MKRGAEHQLSKDDNLDDDNDNDTEEASAPAQGFKKADESTLATRKIRGMPKRSMGTASPPPPLNGITSEASRFGGFSGFGASSNSSPFSFTPPTAPTTSAFGSNVSLTVAPSASPATKTFASFLNNSSPRPSPSPAPPTSPALEPKEESDAAALRYYSSLRGLNVSVLCAISKAVEADPFVDVADVLERYQSLRVSVQKEFDEKADANKTAGTMSSAAMPPSTPTPNPKPTMPSPPSAFAGFGPVPNPSTSSSLATGGFVPKAENTGSSSAFSFLPTSTPTSASTPSKTSPFAFPMPDSSSKISPFGPGPTIDTADSSTQKPSSSSSTISFESTAFSSSKSISSPFTFGSSKSAFSEVSKPNESTTAPASSTLFGKSSPFSSAANPFGGEKSSQAPTPFSGTFGSASASKPSPFGSFAKPSGSIGNPVGFGFGSPPKTPDVEGPLSSSKGTTNGFSFSATATPVIETQTNGEGTPDDEQGDAVASDDTEEGSKLNTKTHDKEGEGEEDEETTHVVKAKVYKLAKVDTKWTDMGVGMLRLKKHKVSGARRVLLRNSSTGKIIINFIIYPGLSPTSTSHFVSFVGHEDGSSTAFKLRLKTEADAGELKAAMDREIALVQVKTP